MFTRMLNKEDLSRRSCFLWGPRQTGKSTLLRHLFSETPYYDLLDAALFRRLSGRPGLLEEELSARFASKAGVLAPVVMDEVQKLPELVDEVQRLISAHGWKFILSGSSARKLKRGGGNMLGGRAVRRELLPLTAGEIPGFSLDRALNHGLLPAHYLDDDPAELVAAYVGTYLREEILAESLVRSLPTFQRFLEVAALCNGQPIQFASIARDVGLSAPGIRGYFEILTDTLLGGWVPAWQKRQRRRIVAAPRFYFFDICLVNDLTGRGRMSPGSSDYGSAFEHFIYMEIRAFIAYRQLKDTLSYWRTSSGLEVDFILGGGKTAIEVKSVEDPSSNHTKGLRAWQEDNPGSRCLLVCRTHKARRTSEGIDILPWQDFIERLWGGELEL